MKLPPAYTPHLRFAAQAEKRGELWRIPATFVVMICVGNALLIGMQMLGGLGGVADPAEQTASALTEPGFGPRSLLLLLLGTGFWAVGLVIAMRVLHDRGLASLIGHLPIALDHAGKVALWVGALCLGLMIVLPYDPALQRNAAMPGGLWIMLLPLGMLAILVQVSSEELVFRGYLQQQLAVRFASPVLFMGVPALVFALIHGSPLAGDNAFMIMCWAGAFGLAAGDLTARTGTLGAAIGLHFANNVLAFMGVSLLGPYGVLALFHLPLMPDDPALQSLILPEIATLFCAWLTARLVLRV